MKNDNRIQPGCLTGIKPVLALVILVALMVVPAMAENVIRNPGFEDLGGEPFLHWVGGEVYPADVFGTGDHVAKIPPGSSITQSFSGNPDVSPPREALEFIMDANFVPDGMIEVHFHFEGESLDPILVTGAGIQSVTYELNIYDVQVGEGSSLVITNQGESEQELYIDNVMLMVMEEVEPTPEPTPDPTGTPTETPTVSPTPTGSETPTPTPSETPDITPTPTITLTPTPRLATELRVTLNPRVLRVDRRALLEQHDTSGYRSRVTISALTSGGDRLTELTPGDISIGLPEGGGYIHDLRSLINFPGVVEAIFTPEELGRFPIEVRITNSAMYDAIADQPKEAVEVRVEAIERTGGSRLDPPERNILYKKPE